MKKAKIKKLLPLIAVIVAVGAIGVTIAYNKDSSVLQNQFSMAGYQTVFTDTFNSPDDWTPCDVTPKEVKVTNTGNMPVSVRIKLEEKWRNAADTEDLPLERGRKTLADIIYSDDAEDWIETDGWYYYEYDLAPGETTSSLIEAVRLNCSANFGGDNVCTETPTGAVCEKPADEYEGAKYHLKVTAQTSQVGATPKVGRLYARILRDYRANDAEIKFYQNALAGGNGNGLNKYTENGQPIYYYRGDDNANNVQLRNYVMWANKCWRIIRTTAAGGIKMIYSGETCNADEAHRGFDPVVYSNALHIGLAYNDNANSPADVGYMYGERIEIAKLADSSSTLVFSKNVSRSDNSYTLDTSPQQSVSRTLSLADSRYSNYRYFCTDGEVQCDGARIAYLIGGHENESGVDYYYYLPLGGYGNIEEAENAMYSNREESTVKKIVEYWFEQNNLDDYEDDLEDATYCNNRQPYYLEEAMYEEGYYPYTRLTYDSYGRYRNNTYYVYEGGTIVEKSYAPALECSHMSDAFRVSNPVAPLKHKVGLITYDELVLAGINDQGYSSTNHYLYQTLRSWTMTPAEFRSDDDAKVYAFGANANVAHASSVDEDSLALRWRPVVTLKPGIDYENGNGSKGAPYRIH